MVNLLRIVESRERRRTIPNLRRGVHALIVLSLLISLYRWQQASPLGDRVGAVRVEGDAVRSVDE